MFNKFSLLIIWLFQSQVSLEAADLFVFYEPFDVTAPEVFLDQVDLTLIFIILHYFSVDVFIGWIRFLAWSFLVLEHNAFMDWVNILDVVFLILNLAWQLFCHKRLADLIAISLVHDWATVYIYRMVVDLKESWFFLIDNSWLLMVYNFGLSIDDGLFVASTRTSCNLLNYLRIRTTVQMLGASFDNFYVIIVIIINV